MDTLDLGEIVVKRIAEGRLLIHPSGIEVIETINELANRREYLLEAIAEASQELADFDALQVQVAELDLTE